MSIQSPLKTCSRCGTEKPLDDFALRSSTTKGLVPRTYCKECDVPKGLTPEQNRRKQLMARYHLTPAQFNDMGEEQHWRCAICIDDIREKPYVDHNHITGDVRALLCFHCNLALGHLKDDIDTARAVVRYLEKHYVYDTSTSE